MEAEAAAFNGREELFELQVREACLWDLCGSIAITHFPPCAAF